MSKNNKNMVYVRTYVPYRMSNTAQNMKFSIKDFLSKCDQVRSLLQIWSHLLKKSLTEKIIFCAMKVKCLKDYGHTFPSRCNPYNPSIRNESSSFRDQFREDSETYHRFSKIFC